MTLSGWWTRSSSASPRRRARSGALCGCGGWLPIRTCPLGRRASPASQAARRVIPALALDRAPGERATARARRQSPGRPSSAISICTRTSPATCAASRAAPRTTSRCWRTFPASISERSRTTPRPCARWIGGPRASSRSCGIGRAGSSRSPATSGRRSSTDTVWCCFPTSRSAMQRRYSRRLPELTPTALWEHLGSRAAITIPHHPSHALAQPLDWSFRDDRFQRLVEIFQSRGSYEFDGAPVRRSCKANSFRDTASGMRSRWATGSGSSRAPTTAAAWGWRASGRATCLGKRLFEALYARRTFGTTGAKLDLFMTVAGAPQGSEIRRPRLACAIRPAVGGPRRGSSSRSCATAWSEAARLRGHRRLELALDGRRPPPRARYYYLRARQSDGHMGWTSPVWLGPPGAR